MILGTGIDIIEVERVKRAAAKEGFMERVFTETERQRLKSCNNDPQRRKGGRSKGAGHRNRHYRMEGNRDNP